MRPHPPRPADTVGELYNGDKLVARLPPFEYGESLGPREQRSFRYPMQVEADVPLGEYTLTCRTYYNTRDKACAPTHTFAASHPVAC